MQGQKELRQTSKGFHSLLKPCWYLAESEVSALSCVSFHDSLFALA